MVLKTSTVRSLNMKKDLENYQENFGLVRVVSITYYDNATSRSPQLGASQIGLIILPIFNLTVLFFFVALRCPANISIARKKKEGPICSGVIGGGSRPGFHHFGRYHYMISIEQKRKQNV